MFVLAVSFVKRGRRTRDFASVSLCYGRSGEEICMGYAECNMITNKQTMVPAAKPHHINSFLYKPPQLPFSSSFLFFFILTLTQVAAGSGDTAFIVQRWFAVFAKGLRIFWRHNFLVTSSFR